jgi:hypothetical protein
VYITAVEDMRETTEDAMEDIQGEIDDTIDKIIEI